MSELRPAYFVVRRTPHGREVPEIFWDELPRSPPRNLVYIVRLDQLPNADVLVSSSLHELFCHYQHLKASGKLPPRWKPPPRPKGEPAKSLVGHRENQRDVVQRTQHIDPGDEGAAVEEVVDG